MLPDAVLLFPDTGPDFLRSLAASALYADRVQILTMTTAATDEIVAEWTSGATEVASWPERSDPPSANAEIRALKRIASYLSFVHSAARSFRLLEDAGILLPGPAVDFAVVDAPRAAADGHLGNVEWGKLPRSVFDEIDRGYDASPPCFADLDAVSVFIRILSGEPVDRPSDFDLWSRMYFTRYLTTLNVLAERSGAVPVTWDPRFARALAACRSLYVPDDETGGPRQPTDLARQRRVVEAALGRVVLERALPRVDDLPFEDILELRERRKPELVALRTAIGALATRVDVESSSSEKVELQMRDLIATEVDPAIHDLRAALFSSRANAIGRLAGSKEALAAAAVPTALALTAGAPISLAAAFAGASALAAPLLEATVERRKLLRASQWSVLLRLDRASEHR